MRFRGRLIASVLAATLAAACYGGPDAGIPDATADVRLNNLTALDIRVAEVAWRLARANTDLCPVNRPGVGWTLHSASQYGGEVRPLAEARFGLDGDLPGVLAAPVGSPAEVAGLREGDLILSVNGRGLERGQTDRQSYQGLQANLALLDRAAGMGPLQLQVRRAGVERTVRVRPVPACAYQTQVEVTGTLRSRTDGRTIFVSDGLANLMTDDDALAFGLAHELSHAVLEHRTDDSVTGVRGASNWAISLRRGLSLGSEADADHMGVFLAARAGFDPAGAIAFMEAWEKADPGAGQMQINLGGVYGSFPQRRAALEMVIEDVQARRASGRVLIP